MEWEPDGRAFRIAGLDCLFDEPGIGVIYLAPRWDPEASSDLEVCGDGESATVEGAEGEAACRSAEGQGSSRLMLVVAGTDAAGLGLALKVATPTIPPMTRAPFTNQVPDFMVLGPEAHLLGTGGVRAAGFWSADWAFDSRSSYSSCALDFLNAPV